MEYLNWCEKYIYMYIYIYMYWYNRCQPTICRNQSCQISIHGSHIIGSMTYQWLCARLVSPLLRHWWYCIIDIKSHFDNVLKYSDVDPSFDLFLHLGFPSFSTSSIIANSYSQVYGTYYTYFSKSKELSHLWQLKFCLLFLAEFSMNERKSGWCLEPDCSW